MTTNSSFDQWRGPRAGEYRGPCPALNALANGGDLPRDGVVTVDELVRALDERLGVPPSMGKLLAKIAMSRLGKPGPDGVLEFNLSALTLHGFLEHDASLTRRDARDGDAAAISPPLVAQLLSMSQDGLALTLEDLATAHQLRMKQSAAGGHRVPLKAGVIGTFEAALVYQVLRVRGAVLVNDARELFGRERFFPRVLPRRVRWSSLLITALRLAVMGNWPFSQAVKRARVAARHSRSRGSAGCPFATVSAAWRGAVGGTVPGNSTVPSGAVPRGPAPDDDDVAPSSAVGGAGQRSGERRAPRKAVAA